MNEKRKDLPEQKIMTGEKNTVSFIWLSGAISVKAALEAGKRECLELVVNRKKRSKDFAYIIALAKKAGIPVVFSDKEEMEKIVPAPNGGILLKASPRKLESYSSSTRLSSACFYLAGLEDPHNLGSCIRTLYAAGVSAVLLKERDWSYADPIILKASAGTWDKMTIYTIPDEDLLLQIKKEQNISLVSASRKQAVSLFEMKWPQNVLIVLGGALRGISSAVEMGSDQRVYIPYGREFRNSLDTPSACAIMAYDWLYKKEKDPCTQAE